MAQLRQKHIAFINAYTSLGQETYQNISKSARLAGYSEKSAHTSGKMLLNRPEIAREIATIIDRQNQVALERQDISKEKYLGMMTEAYEICGPKHSNAPRYAELIGKVKGFFTDMVNNVLVYNASAPEVRENVDAKISSIARRLAKSSKSEQ